MRSHLNTECLRTRLSNSEFGVRSLCETPACCQDGVSSNGSDEGEDAGGWALAADLKESGFAELPIPQASGSAFMQNGTCLRCGCAYSSSTAICSDSRSSMKLAASWIWVRASCSAFAASPPATSSNRVSCSSQMSRGLSAESSTEPITR